MQQEAGVAEPNAPIISSSEISDAWDDLAFDPVLPDADTTPISFVPEPVSFQRQRSHNPKHDIGPAPIEDQIIALCSNGNISANYRNLELSHRISSAEDQLNQIRNLIAEKSFQFSHVIRISPRKRVTTRARSAVKKLNNQIAEHCRFYARCRSSLVILGAEPAILSHFKVLNPVDVVGSTAVLNPNLPGSTKIKLSWIWQSSARNILAYTGLTTPDTADDQNTPANDFPTLLECRLT